MEFGMIHHVAMDVTDYDRSKDFYVNKLGFAVLGEYVYPNGMKRLDIQRLDARLELFWKEDMQILAPRPHSGFRHLCFRTKSIHEAVAHLHAQGIETEEIRPDPMAGGLLTFFYDPDGLQLELHE